MDSFAQMRRSLMLTVAIISPSCGPASTAPSGPPIDPTSVVVPGLVPANFIWQSPAELDAWVTNAVSRGAELVVDDATAFIRIRLGPDSFTLRSPDLPAESPPMTGVRIVYRWQPSEARHPLNTFDLTAVPFQKRYEYDKAILIFGLLAQEWTAVEGSPITSPGLPFVARYVYFDAGGTITPGVLDIQRIELTR